jgi:hypothetical protein
VSEEVTPTRFVLCRPSHSLPTNPPIPCAPFGQIEFLSPTPSSPHVYFCTRVQRDARPTRERPCGIDEPLACSWDPTRRRGEAFPGQTQGPVNTTLTDFDTLCLLHHTTPSHVPGHILPAPYDYNTAIVGTKLLIYKKPSAYSAQRHFKTTSLVGLWHFLLDEPTARQYPASISLHHKDNMALSNNGRGNGNATVAQR